MNFFWYFTWKTVLYTCITFWVKKISSTTITKAFRRINKTYFFCFSSVYENEEKEEKENEKYWQKEGIISFFYSSNLFVWEFVGLFSLALLRAFNFLNRNLWKEKRKRNLLHGNVVHTNLKETTTSSTIIFTLTIITGDWESGRERRECVQNFWFFFSSSKFANFLCMFYGYVCEYVPCMIVSW